MDVASELNITPLDALLLSVRQAGGRVAWTESMLARAVRAHVEAGGDPSKPSREVRWWLEESRRERRMLTSTSKAAVDAGAAAALVSRIGQDATHLLDALAAGLDALGLPAEERRRAFEASQTRMLALADELEVGAQPSRV